MMAGGAELEQLAHELDREGGRGGIGAEMAAEVQSLPH